MWFLPEDLEKKRLEFEQRTHNLSPFGKMRAWKKQLDEDWNAIEACVLEFKAGHNILTGGRFDTFSLGTWMAIIQEAGVHAVPIELVGMIKTLKDAQEGMLIPFTLNEEQEKYAGVVRLDSIGSNLIKAHMTFRGRNEKQSVLGAVFDEKQNTYGFCVDDRIARSALSYVGQIGKNGDIDIPIWWRPWVKSISIPVSREPSIGRDVDYWPLEWRAYIQHGELAGISAYYIQAPISAYRYRDDHFMLQGSVREPIVRRDIKAIYQYVDNVLELLRERAIQPFHPLYLSDPKPHEDISFTMDFLSIKPGLIFLEAGPRVPVDENNVPVRTVGAHPCFFENKPVKGIAFGYDDIVPLAEYL